MSSVRISAFIRDEIVANVLAHKFAVERATIAEKEGGLEFLKDERNKLGYEMVFNTAQRKRLNDAPAGWFPESHSVRVMVEDAGVQDVKFGKGRLVPYDVHSGGWQHVSAIVQSDDPYFIAEKRVNEAKEELKDLRSALHTEESAARARVFAVLNSVTTTGRLLEVWPEVHQFLPEMVSSSSGGVPAEFIGDLNTFLNIGA